ncbi:MAG: hypothetical protein FWC00_04915 [Firmicutes bacterium]|nr:hypothetical protein [Bacillota bacterium]
MARRRIRITKLEIKICVIIVLVTLAAAVGFTFMVMDRHDARLSRYTRAALVDNDDAMVRFLHDTLAGEAFVTGTITAQGSAYNAYDALGLHGAFVHIRLVREVLVQRGEDSEWQFESQVLRRPEGNVYFGQISFPSTALWTGEHLDLRDDEVINRSVLTEHARTVHNLTGSVNLTNQGRNLEFRPSFSESVAGRRPIRYSVFAIPVGATFSTFVNFDGEPWADNSVILHNMTAQELHDHMVRESLVGPMVGVWVGWFILTLFLCIVFIVIDKKWLHPETKPEPQKKQSRTAAAKPKSTASVKAPTKRATPKKATAETPDSEPVKKPVAKMQQE